MRNRELIKWIKMWKLKSQILRNCLYKKYGAQLIKFTNTSFVVFVGLKGLKLTCSQVCLGGPKFGRLIFGGSFVSAMTIRIIIEWLAVIWHLGRLGPPPFLDQIYLTKTCKITLIKLCGKQTRCDKLY